MPPMSRKLAFAALAVLAAAPIAACGDDGGGSAGTTATTAGGADTSRGGGGRPLEVHAKDSLEFDRDAYTTGAGDVHVRYVNDGSLPHTLLVEDVDGFKLGVSGGGDEDEGDVELEPGEYVIYCDVPGHRGAGMEATLTVR